LLYMPELPRSCRAKLKLHCSFRLGLCARADYVFNTCWSTRSALPPAIFATSPSDRPLAQGRDPIGQLQVGREHRLEVAVHVGPEAYVIDTHGIDKAHGLIDEVREGSIGESGRLGTDHAAGGSNQAGVFDRDESGIRRGLTLQVRVREDNRRSG